MSIPQTITIQNNSLPETPGVYIMKDKTGRVLYIGKASSLRLRVSSYFTSAHDNKTEQLVGSIKSIDYIKTDTVLEATFKEADLIKKFQPHFNIMQKDDKSFVYLVITKDEFPHVLLKRGKELDKERCAFSHVFGPFLNAHSLRSSLQLIRTFIPWSNCKFPRSLHKKKGRAKKNARPCFYYHLGQCPGICTGDITALQYAQIIKKIIMFIRGKKGELRRVLKKEMFILSEAKEYEKAAVVRNHIYALEHINDAILLQREQIRSEAFFKRIEGYDISNISGTSATGSMVVFEDNVKNSKEYRMFKIKTVFKSNDTAMIQEVLIRRFRNSWRHPDLIFIDGGIAQVYAAEKIVSGLRLSIPVCGIAKGPARKNARLVYGNVDSKTKQHIRDIEKILQHVQAEAHRFAIAYHKKLRNHALTPSERKKE